MAQDKVQRVVPWRTKVLRIRILFSQGIGVAVNLNCGEIKHLRTPKTERPVFAKVGVIAHSPVQKPNPFLQTWLPRPSPKL